MSAVTYTAKRNIELSGFSASGSDIGADTTDDSFNTGTVSPATNLSGVLNDEWIKVEGFTVSANNGWFQANGNSTAAKIIQDTANLTTEAAGSPVTETITITGYKRGLGQSYSIDLATTVRNRSVTSRKNFSESLNGTREVLFHNSIEQWSVTLAPLPIASMPQIREFIESVLGGESFTFDPYGTVAVPDDPFTAELVSNSYTENEIQFTGYVGASFLLRKAP